MHTNEYIKEHLKFPLATFAVTLAVVFIMNEFTAQKITLLLSAAFIGISIGLIVFKYLSFKKYQRWKDVLVINISIAQIIACLVAIVSVFSYGLIEVQIVDYVSVQMAKGMLYLAVLSVALIVTGNMSMFGGGSLVVIIFSSAALYNTPILIIWFTS